MPPQTRASCYYTRFEFKEDFIHRRLVNDYLVLGDIGIARLVEIDLEPAVTPKSSMPSPPKTRNAAVGSYSGTSPLPCASGSQVRHLSGEPGLDVVVDVLHQAETLIKAPIS